MKRCKKRYSKVKKIQCHEIEKHQKIIKAHIVNETGAFDNRGFLRAGIYYKLPFLSPGSTSCKIISLLQLRINLSVAQATSISTNAKTNL